jgi:Rad3-related DNA helicase
MLDCLDPMPALSRSLAAYQSCVLFSAALQPREAFKPLWADGRGEWECLEPVFPPENLQVLSVRGVDTRYRARGREDKIAAWIQVFAESVPGHAVLYFSSYELLRRVHAALVLTGAVGDRELVFEEPDGGERQRRQWIERFRDPQPLLGFCVLGGSFAEAIELPEGRLKAIAIVGPGIPPPTFRRNLIYEHFEFAGLSGFEHAYRLPGLRKVIQAAGRLIRSPEQRGTLALLGRRFSEPETRQLLPRHWIVEEVATPAAFRRSLRTFWEKAGEW